MISRMQPFTADFAAFAIGAAALICLTLTFFRELDYDKGRVRQFLPSFQDDWDTDYRHFDFTVLLARSTYRHFTHTHAASPPLNR